MSLPSIGENCEPGNIAAKTSTDGPSADHILLVGNLDTVFFCIASPIEVQGFEDTIVGVETEWWENSKFRESNWLGMTSAWNQHPAQQSLPQFVNFTITTTASATAIAFHRS
ncbi:hypothetical protein TWF569_002299 [Orbilia oligospora]|uniref:Uncharacterized protein n=1 Tax=Orbilia oligospora TaxID=2813651 RepID=A0A7C8NQT0_ORBOL|nr:hypothetical protein TWF703_010302 [Orbilia oligospora]KAF3153351.1 hypothetical protein TWF569_002299 [Orbilia oligospora]